MTDRVQLRLTLVTLLVLALMATLLARLWQVQVVGAPQAEAMAATAGRVRTVPVTAERGRILDAQGRVLVGNRARTSLAVDRAVLERQPDGGAAVLGRLGRLLRQPAARLRARTTQCGEPGAAPAPSCWNGARYAPVLLATDVPAAVALAVLERPEAHPGVLVEPALSRTLPAPAGVRAPHLVGHLGAPTAEDVAAGAERTELVGRDGLERTYDADLRGRSGRRRVAVDGAGDVLRTLPGTDPVPGGDLVTSIDARVQRVVEDQLLRAVARARGTVDRTTGRRHVADSAAGVVLEAGTGRVVAMASLPTYDPRLWLDGVAHAELAPVAANGALLDRATQALGPAASPFKVVTATAAARAGYPLDGAYACPSSLRVGDRVFNNYESRAFGAITVGRALEVSCDTVFYRFGLGMWQRGRDDVLETTARSFGLGTPTGVDLPGESSGRVADAAWKRAAWSAQRERACADARRLRGRSYEARLARETCVDGWRWRAGDSVNRAIGQGDTVVTPLQVAAAYGALANGGTVWEPRVGRALVGRDGRVLRDVAPVAKARVAASPQTLSALRSALRATTRRGTAAAPFAGFPLDRLPIAAKTGTAEVQGRQSTSWFVSFDSRFVVLMTVSQGGTGAGTSGPSVRRVWEELHGVRGRDVDPDRALVPRGGLPDPVAAVRAADRAADRAARG